MQVKNLTSEHFHIRSILIKFLIGYTIRNRSCRRLEMSSVCHAFDVIPDISRTSQFERSIRSRWRTVRFHSLVRRVMAIDTLPSACISSVFSRAAKNGVAVSSRAGPLRCRSAGSQGRRFRAAAPPPCIAHGHAPHALGIFCSGGELGE